ncbi:MAG: Cys-tRNA(Pro) deacylase, partial [Clostridium perfringens]
MAKDKKLKTNAMRILDSKKVPYEMLSYESEDGKIDGISVAHKIGVDEKNVFKTLVAQGTSKELYVFVIPVAEELDLKN